MVYVLLLQKKLIICLNRLIGERLAAIDVCFINLYLFFLLTKIFNRMKRNFLLLMLTALLPLAGWAEDIEIKGSGATNQFTFTWKKVTDDKGTVKERTATINGFVTGASKSEITIPATVDFPESDGADPSTFTVTAIKANAFEGETLITSVSFAENSELTEIGANAFLNCTKIESVDFTEAVKLATIGEGAFIGTKILSLNLSTTTVTDIYRLFTKDEDGKRTNGSLQSVTLPKTVGTISNKAFDGCTVLATVNFANLEDDATNVTTIGTSAFANTAIEELNLTNTRITKIPDNLAGATNAKLTTISFPKTLATIPADAFKDYTKLATVNFHTLEDGATNVITIGASAFAKTALTSLDLTNTKITELNELFESVNNKVTSVKLPKTLTTINANAFEGLGALKAVDFTACEANITIKANAFKTTVLLTSIDLPEVGLTLEANSFANTYLQTVTFKGDLATGAVKAGAFVRNGNQTITVNYTPKSDDAIAEKASFAQNAFAAEDAAVWVNFKTTAVYGETLATLPADAEGHVLYGATLDQSGAIAGEGKIPVYRKNATYYYGTFVTPGKIKIAKKQGDANVMVYGAYVDNDPVNGTAFLMDQLHLIGGYYTIPAGEKIIVKSSKGDEVLYSNDASLENSVNYASDGTTNRNEIRAHSGTDVFAASIKEAAAAVDKVVYFLAPIADYDIYWTPFKNERMVSAGQFYLYALPTAGEARIVWLDGSEEDQIVTGINTIENKKAVVDGVIYNLAGQKVDGNYKGVVIKNGQKFIQK